MSKSLAPMDRQLLVVSPSRHRRLTPLAGIAIFGTLSMQTLQERTTLAQSSIVFTPSAGPASLRRRSSVHRVAP
jgi:hypothetical protein